MIIFGTQQQVIVLSHLDFKKIDTYVEEVQSKLIKKKKIQDIIFTRKNSHDRKHFVLRFLMRNVDIFSLFGNHSEYLLQFFNVTSGYF